MLARLQSELLAQPVVAGVPVEVAARAEKVARRPASSWTAILGVAVALSLLIALLRSLPDGQPPQRNGNDPAGDWAAATAWTDPLDERIDEAAEQVQSLVVRGSGIDSSLSGLSEQLQSMSDDLEHGSL